MVVPRSLKERSIDEARKHGWGLLLAQEEALRNLIASMFERRQHIDILEVGCFKGLLVGWLHENFPRPPYDWDYVGVDIVEPFDRRRDYPHYVMNAEALEFPPESFDLVIMIEVLEHVVDYVKALREVHRVLRRGGAVFIQSVRADSPAALADETHFHVLHPKTLSRLLRWLGFSDVEYIDAPNFAVWARK